MNQLLDPARLPTLKTWQRLENRPLDFLNASRGFGTIFLQGRTFAGGLGRFYESIDWIIDRESKSAFAPGSGVEVNFEALAGMHAAANQSEESPVISIDFDFCHRIAGLSLVNLPSLSIMEKLRQAIQLFGQEEIASSAVEEWRLEIQPEWNLCDHCRKLAIERARNPEKHALFRIIHDLADSGENMMVGMGSDHLKLDTWMQPERLSAFEGFLSVNDRFGEAMLHVNLGLVYSLRFYPEIVDGEEFATLQIHDLRGDLNFEIRHRDPLMVRHWKAICDDSGYFDRKCDS